MPASQNQERVDRLRFERRVEDRTSSSGSVIGAFVDDEGAFTLTRVELVDESGAGLGLLSPVRVAAGSRFTLYAGALPTAHDAGVVTRCVPDGEAFRVGLRCHGRAAA